MRILVVLLLILGARSVDAKATSCAQPGDAWIDTSLPDDAIRVRITYTKEGGGTDELWTVPQQRYLCFRTAPAPRGFFDIVAVNAQGHETKVTGASVVFGAPYTRDRHPWGMGGFGILLLFPLGAIIVAIGLFFRSAIRRRRIKQPGEPTTLVLAEGMTRVVIERSVLVILAGFAGAVALYSTGYELYAAALVWLPLARVVRLMIAHRFLAILERAAAPPTIHDNLLAVGSDFIVVPRALARNPHRVAFSPARALIPRATRSATDAPPPKPDP